MPGTPTTTSRSAGRRAPANTPSTRSSSRSAPPSSSPAAEASGWGDDADVMPIGFSAATSRGSGGSSQRAPGPWASSPATAPPAPPAFVATSGCWGENDRARRGDIEDSMVRIPGHEDRLRPRQVPIVCEWQQSLIEYAVEHAKGRRRRYSDPGANVRRELQEAMDALELERCSPNDLRPLAAPGGDRPGAGRRRPGARGLTDGGAGLRSAQRGGLRRLIEDSVGLGTGAERVEEALSRLLLSALTPAVSAASRAPGREILRFPAPEPFVIAGKLGAQGRNRTTDTGIFSPLLYRLSYLGAPGRCF